MDNDEFIWMFLKNQGFTDYGCAGLMGNLAAESGLNPNNLQNSYNTKLGMSDAEYVAAVNNGTYSEYKFVHDSAGFGLAQWTYWSRKQNLYTYMSSHSYGIGNLQGQLEFLMQELCNSYGSVYNTLRTATSMIEASNAVMLNFERPANQAAENQRARANNGLQYYNKFSGKTITDIGDLMAQATYLYTTDEQLNMADVSYLEDEGKYVERDAFGNVKNIYMIDPMKLKPFMVLVDKNFTNISYDMLKEERVSGIMFDAGELFDSAHLKKNYRNENLFKQVISAAKEDFPFALLAHSKARNVQEALQETSELYYIISKYPPPLGLFIHPSFANKQPKAINDQIIELYFNKMVSWGLNGATGLYCTENELDGISWDDNFKDKFALWYVNHGDLGRIDDLLYPEFFQI